LLTKIFLFGSPTSVLYRSEIVRGEQDFFDEGSLHDDTDACYRVLQDWDFGFVHQLLSFLRTDNASILTSVRDYDPFALDSFLMAQKYARVFLAGEEVARCLKRADRRYFRRVGPRLLKGAPKGYWEYHRKGLMTIGYRLNRFKLAKWALLEMLDMVGNPLATAERALRKWRAVLQAREGHG
jgi:hypothetical protein